MLPLQSHIAVHAFPTTFRACRALKSFKNLLFSYSRTSKRDISRVDAQFTQ